MTVARARRALTRREIRERALAMCPPLSVTLIDGVGSFAEEREAARRTHVRRMQTDKLYRAWTERCVQIEHARADAENDVEQPSVKPAVYPVAAPGAVRSRPRASRRAHRAAARRAASSDGGGSSDPPPRRSIRVTLPAVDAAAVGRLARLLVERAVADVLGRQNSDGATARTVTPSEEKVL